MFFYVFKYQPHKEMLIGMKNSIIFFYIELIYKSYELTTFRRKNCILKLYAYLWIKCLLQIVILISKRHFKLGKPSRMAGHRSNYIYPVPTVKFIATRENNNKQTRSLATRKNNNEVNHLWRVSLWDNFLWNLCHIN